MHTFNSKLKNGSVKLKHAYFFIQITKFPD